jgi:hypothetical protein
MRAVTGELALVDAQRIFLDHLKPVAEDLAQLEERGDAAPVALDSNDRRAGVQ